MFDQVIQQETEEVDDYPKKPLNIDIAKVFPPSSD
jgi:hypothetical protein